MRGFPGTVSLQSRDLGWGAPLSVRTSNNGWDLAGATGTPVRAINRGRVVFAGMMHATGNTVIIHHGLDLVSLYAHFSRISVRDGQMLSKGKRLGVVGSTGLSTAPHLRLTVKVGDIPVNPLLVLDQELSWGK
jgi:murein DD-endopeptidase MepM/ murein hydrolase activator NlpD